MSIDCIILQMGDLNGLHIIVLLVSGLLLLLLLLFLLRTTNRTYEKRRKQTPGVKAAEKPCPLCREMLKSGETVHSVLYPGKPDSLMEIYGCPYCEPGKSSAKPKNKRICPVCKKEIPPDGFVIARVFEKPGKKHVHVLGCTDCYSGKPKTGSV